MAYQKDVSVSISFGFGSFEKGFPVRVRLLDHQGGELDSLENALLTPQAGSIPEHYDEWKALYEQQAQVRSGRQIDVVPQKTHRSLVSDCKDAAETLLQHIGSVWFNPSEPNVFSFLQEWIRGRTSVQEDQSIPIVFKFDTGNDEQNALLKRLPWHTWDLFKELSDKGLSNAEPTITNNCTKITEPLPSHLNILAIYGSNEGGLKLEEDDAEIQRIKAVGATITQLPEPSRRELHKVLTDDTQSWDILFFAGHSFSNANLSSGTLQIRRGDQGIYKLDELYYDLASAVKRGLKIAIFNSCDGLGIADYLSNTLQIPCVIVFKEAVPDEVAREFLKDFLKEFKKGTPLYLAVRQARASISWMERAEEEEGGPFPCASWLPIVCQNPKQPEFVWQKNAVISPSPPSLPRYWIVGSIVVFLITAITTALIYKGLESSRSSKNPNEIENTDVVSGEGAEPLTNSVENVPPSNSEPVAKFADVADVPTGTFRYGGSTTWALLRGDIEVDGVMTTVVDLIKEAHPSFNLDYIRHPKGTEPGTTTGIQMLLNNLLDFAEASRDLEEEELEDAEKRGLVLKEIPVAWDGIAFAVHHTLNVEGLTIDEIKGIYTGNITNWDKVGGPNLDITPYTRDPQAGGTVGFFIDQVLKDLDFGTTVQFIPITTEGLGDVSEDPGGIYYASAPEVFEQCTIKPLPVGHKKDQLVALHKLPLVPPNECGGGGIAAAQ